MHQSFYLKKPSTFTFDKSYKVFITKEKLFFFKIDYKFDEDNDVWFSFSGLIYMLRDMIFKKTAERSENKIDQAFQNDQLELLKHKNNFQLNVVDIKSVEVNEKPTSHSFLQDNGTLLFILDDNKRYRFIMPSSISRELIMNLLEEAGVSLEIQRLNKY